MQVALGAKPALRVGAMPALVTINAGALAGLRGNWGEDTEEIGGKLEMSPGTCSAAASGLPVARDLADPAEPD